MMDIISVLEQWGIEGEHIKMKVFVQGVCPRAESESHSISSMILLRSGNFTAVGGMSDRSILLSGTNAYQPMKIEREGRL